MITKTYNDLNDRVIESQIQVSELMEFLEPRLLEKYPHSYLKNNNGVDTIQVQLSKIVVITDGDLEGKVILDLGCGSVNGYDGFLYSLTKAGICFSDDDFSFHSYEPWLCRALCELGAKPIGIDRRGLENEEFEHHELDLLEDNLDVIPDSSIDVVNMYQLLTSSIFSKNGDYKMLMEKLIPQLRRILKPEGVFVYDTS